tara:strand:+ start:451 stop:864 length:414 start_codon:yes stop_codon:yes gene_type:complete
MYKKSAPTNKNVGPGDPPKKAKASNVLKKPSYALSQKIDKITGDTTSYEMIPGPKKWVDDDTFGRVQMSTLNSNRISNEEYKKRMKSSNTVAKMNGKKGSPAHMSRDLSYGGPVIDQMGNALSHMGASKVLKHMKSK